MEKKISVSGVQSEWVYRLDEKIGSKVSSRARIPRRWSFG